MIRFGAIAAAVVVVFVVAGCAPATTSALPTHPPSSAVTTPTPAPTAPPALADLVLTPDGLGPLRIGSPIATEPTAAAVVNWNPTKCGSAGGAWIPNYPDGPGAYNLTSPPFYFAMAHQTDTLTYLNVDSLDVRTATGIHIGSTVDQLKAAYSKFASTKPVLGVDLYVLNGVRGQLVFEVPTDTSHGAALANTVALMELSTRGQPVSPLLDNDAGGGICP